MTRRTSNDMARDSCETPRRGTMDGVAEHRRRHTHMCSPCRRARADYISEQVARFEAPGIVCPPARLAFAQDYLWLIQTGETNGEAISRRLGYRTSAAVERQLARAGIRPLHESPHVEAGQVGCAA